MHKKDGDAAAWWKARVKKNPGLAYLLYVAVGIAAILFYLIGSGIQCGGRKTLVTANPETVSDRDDKRDALEKEYEAMPDGKEKDNAIKGAYFMEKIIVSNSLRSMSMSAGTQFPYNLAEGFALMTNRHFFKGLGKILTPVKAPKLPKEEK